MSFLYFLEHGEHIAALQAKERAVHLGSIGARGVLALRSAKRIVIVRDPFSRTLSAFLQKFHSPDYQRNFGPFELNPEGFSAFLSFLLKGGLRANSHWSPQTDRLLLAPEQYNAVLSFSDFPANLVRTVEAWVPETRKKWTEFSPVDIDGPPRTDASEKVAAFYNRDDISMVEQLYHKDFEVPQIRDEANRMRAAFESLEDSQ